jgi:hypothetical protein
MWADEEAWTPAGAVPVRWVTSDTMLSSLELPHEAPSLLCEECETRDALVWSEADKEACCATCCLLLYPRTTNGKPHENFLKYRIRVVSQGDRSRALRQQQVLLLHVTPSVVLLLLVEITPNRCLLVQRSCECDSDQRNF